MGVEKRGGKRVRHGRGASRWTMRVEGTGQEICNRKGERGGRW